MKRYFIYIFIAAVSVAMSLTSRASNFADESLNYKVMYKWGLINKQAGHATLTLRNVGKEYQMTLTAASEKWADAFYKVRDTLEGRVDIATFRPIVYKKMSHEGGETRIDVVNFQYPVGNKVVGKTRRRQWDKNNELKIDRTQMLEAEGTTVDMLCSFYYMRRLSFPTFKSGHNVKINIFSGKRKELLTITYLGEEAIEIDGKTYNTYHISFNFTDPESPKKETSDPMDAWISTDASRIPLKLEGKLRVGKVQCYFTGKN